MSNPTPFTPSYEYSGVTPVSGSHLDNDFANVKTTTDQIIAGLEDVRRADGALNNGIVTPDSLNDAVKSLFGQGTSATVLAALPNINAVAAALASVALVSANVTNVGTVASNIGNVNSVATNLASIMAALAGALNPANNLSDLPNKATARTNLGVADLGALTGGNAMQHRRGTTLQHAAFTGALGEITVDTDKKVPVAHDGLTAGGFALVRQDTASMVAAGHIGLKGDNDGTTPNSKFVVSSIATTYWNATGGTVTVRGGASLTVDLSVAGPAANGRDQSGAFTANSKVNIYKIYNGTTEALIASLAAPGTGGPALPSGYTYWSYVGTVVLDGSANLLKMYIRGNRVTFQAEQNVLASGTAAGETSVSYAGFVPTFALDLTLNCYGGATTAAAASIANVIRLVTGVNFDQASVVSENAGTGYAGYGRTLTVPNLASQAVINVWVGTASSYSSTIAVQSFTVPNGAM